MSNIVVMPKSARKVQTKEKEVKSHRLLVFIKTDIVPLRQIDEYLDFLALVYGTPIRNIQRDGTTGMFTLWLQNRSEVGLKVASWLYGVSFETTIN